MAVAEASKDLWVATNRQEIYTGSVEAGVETFILEHTYEADFTGQILELWKGLAEAAVYQVSDNLILDQTEGVTIGAWEECESGEDLKALEKRAGEDFGGVLVVAASDWSIIPAENLVAAFQNSKTKLMMTAETAEEGRTLLGALETGVDGIVLVTDDLEEVRKMQKYMQSTQCSTNRMELEIATVTRIDTVGMGDRVCVDLCANMSPGEGMLVGNFCRTLFLVHSECAESAYINSRPFRVNAGPVHAYTAANGGKTSYLAELKAGQDVLVVDADGTPRTEVVGRCKVERRPLVLIDAETFDGQHHSILLQNAETVKLVGPIMQHSSPDPDKGALKIHGAAPAELSIDHTGPKWRTVAVTEMSVGDSVYVRRSDAGVGRHMGTAVQETLKEW